MAESGAGKPYKRVARTHAFKPERWPPDKKSIKVTTAPIRLDRNPSGQNRKAPPHPW